MNIRNTQFSIGQVVRHRVYPFRGVIVDVEPEFNNSEEWWQAIPEEVRPRKDQPFYHLLAENEDTSYVAYVSEQNLLIDDSGIPVNHPEVAQVFGEFLGNSYEIPSVLLQWDILAFMQHSANVGKNFQRLLHYSPGDDCW